MSKGALQENQEGLKNIFSFLISFSIIILIIHAFFYCYTTLKISTNNLINNIILFFYRDLHLFSTPYLSLSVAYFFLIVYAFFSGANMSIENTIKLGKLEVKISKQNGWILFITGSITYFISPLWLTILNINVIFQSIFYCFLLLISFLLILLGGKFIIRVMDIDEDKDYFNEIQRSAFPQCELKIENAYSINIPTIYRFGKSLRHGWINIINPFRATAVMGTPGSGKTFSFINEFIRQHISKGFAMYVYDFKYPNLTKLTYNNYLLHKNNKSIFPVTPKFRMINFDDPRMSHRINPIKADTLTDMSDAYESAYTIMVSLNRTWSDKQGDFFVESPINFLTAVIWYLKIAEGGKYCTMPHAIEWCGRKTTDIIAIMATHKEIAGYMQPFYEALERGVYEQLEGQVSSVQIPLARLKSDDMYWVLSGNDFPHGLNINDPNEPIILCIGNNPDRQTVYSSSLSLINGRLIKNINKPKRKALSIIIDELPTIFFRGLDNLISTARSNKISTCIGYQDNTQLISNYGENEAKKIIRTVGNTISGQVNREAAKELQEMFGKNKQHKRSISAQTDGSLNVNVDEFEDYMIPESTIAQLSQGEFVGITADDVSQKNTYPVFFAKTNLDIDNIEKQEKTFKDLPQIYYFNDNQQFQKIAELLKSKISSSNIPLEIKKVLSQYISKIENFDFENKKDSKQAEMIIINLKQTLLSFHTFECDILLSTIDQYQRETMNERMKSNAEKIDKELDELIERELEKINKNPQFEHIRKMRNRILGINEL